MMCYSNLFWAGVHRQFSTFPFRLYFIVQKQCHLHLILLQVWLQKISIPPPRMVYFYFEHPTPLGRVAFETPTPSEFPMIINGVGMDIFWNHTLVFDNILTLF